MNYVANIPHIYFYQKTPLSDISRMWWWVSFTERWENIGKPFMRFPSPSFNVHTHVIYKFFSLSFSLQKKTIMFTCCAQYTHIRLKSHSSKRRELTKQFRAVKESIEKCILEKLSQLIGSESIRCVLDECVQHKSDESISSTNVSL